MSQDPICRVGLINLTKHEETPMSHDFHPTVITFSLSYLSFLIEFSSICNQVTHMVQPQETISV